MKAKALVPFYNSQLGLVKRGQVFEIPKDFKDLNLVEEVKDDQRTTPAKSKNRTAAKKRSV